MVKKSLEKVKVFVRLFLHGYKIPEDEFESGFASTQDLHEGFVHRNKKYTPFTTLPRHHTALTGLHRKQFFVLLGIFVLVFLAALISWRSVLLWSLVIVTALYFFDLFFNLFLVIRSFTKSPEIRISEEEVHKAGKEWPSYTVFCPLYKEWQVLPQFVDAIGELDYPKNKVQVLLLLEENDKETVAHARSMKLPKNFEIVVVPHGIPKTKPKAMNFGLLHATGEYLVVYDAEDKPEPLQLKRAVLAFRQSDESIVCVQAKLNFYNPNQNLLTRIFTAEYSLWFDLILPGLQSIKAPIPLGGTSNHFKTEMVRKLKGWDPFNVTEDCDLGLRLAKLGYHTAIIDSTTYEEANSDTLNWYNQRSRWIKGYMQTYLVHMRHPLQLWHGVKKPNLIYFQLIVGGKILSLFLNPLFWLITIVYFAFRATVGPAIEQFFPSTVLYMGVVCLIFGNFLYLYYYMIGLAKRKKDGLIIFALVVPLYWIGMSIAAWKAFYELIFKPHYWSKTVHGLHLAPAAPSALAASSVFVAPVGVTQSKDFFGSIKTAAAKPFVLFKSSDALRQGSALTAFNIFINFLNMAFNIYLARTLSLDKFGTFVFLSTALSLIQIFSQVFGGTIKQYVGQFVAAKQIDRGVAFAKQSVWTGFSVTLFFCGILIPLLPYISNKMGLQQEFLALFMLAIPFSFYSSVWQGFSGGVWKFARTGKNSLIETLVKFGAAWGFIYIGKSELVALSLPISLIVLSVLARLTAWREIQHEDKTKAYIEEPFPAKFYVMSLLSGLSVTAFLTLDVMMAKLYLSSEQVGQYAVLTFAGKMVFFAGSLFTFYLSNLVANLEAGIESAKKQIYMLFAAVATSALAAWVIVGLFGSFTMPLLLGDKARDVSSLFAEYALGSVFFTVASVLAGYQIARKRYWYWTLSFTSVLVMVGMIFVNHNSVSDIVNGFFMGAVTNLVTVGLFSVFTANRFAKRAVNDLLATAGDLKLQLSDTGKLRILIFNWRDINHTFAGGAEVYAHELARRWVRDGNQVVLFSGNDGSQLSEEFIDGIHVIRRGGFYMVYIWAFVYYMRYFRGKFDIILDCHNGIPFFAPLYTQEKVVCLLHHVHQEVFRKYLPWYLAKLAGFLEKHGMSFVYRNTEYITVSESSKKEMEELGLRCKSISVVHPGVDLSELIPGKKDKEPLVVYVGRLKAYKSVDVLIRAYKKVLETIPKAKLVIAGGGEEFGALKKLAQELGLADRINFAGKIKHKEKISLMQKAWVFAIPSMMEGWGITAIEANACGVPVVASNVPGLRESVNNPHTGYLVPHGDHDKFAEKISYLLTDHKQRKWMEGESLTWAKQFDWEKSAGRALEVIHHRREIE